MVAQIKPKNEIIRAKSSGFGKLFIFFLMTIPVGLGWIWYIQKRNYFRRELQRIQETASGIDVQLKKRFDLLNKLVDAVKGSMKFEKSTLQTITELRQQKGNRELKPNEMGNYNEEISKIMSGINVQLENYPDLKSSNNVMQLQNAAQDCEDNISAARRFYNTSVRSFNSDILVYPNNVAASGMNLETQLYFEASNEERQDVKIDLSF